MKRILLISMIYLLGCSTSKKVLDSLETIEASADKSYAYTIDNPILIGKYNSWQRNSNLAHFYMSKLTFQDRNLQCVMHATIRKPDNQPRKPQTGLPNRYAVSNNLGGEYLDKYWLVPRGTTDTLTLFFDVEIDGVLKLPHGMDIDVNQTNNIYSY